MKMNCINQLDHILYRLESPNLVAISLLPKIINGHISTPIIFSTLEGIESIQICWFSLIEKHVNLNTHLPLLCLSENGDSFVLTDIEAGRFLLKSFNQPTEEVESFWLTEAELINGLGILPQALSITKKQTPSALAQPFLPPPSKDADLDGSATKEHYVIRHFRRQSRTALSIIGISVVIALLGVITPLGFQTFTDKILPYNDL